MSDYVNNLISRLREVNTLLAKPHDKDEIIITKAIMLSSFFNDFGDTSQLIDEVERQAKEDISKLQQDISSILKEITAFNSIDLSAWKDVDFEDIVNTHLKPFEDRYNVAKDKSTKLWQDYQSKSNRLDYLPLDSEEYKLLDKECDAAKAEYDKAHKETEKQYKVLRQEQDKCTSIYYFNIEWLKILISEIQHIADTITRETKEIGKEEIL